MEIDASIPLSFRPAQVNPGEALQTAMTVGQLARLRRQDEILEEDRRRAAAVRGATTFLEDGSIDEVGTIRKLTGLVGPDEISKLRHGWQSDRLALRKADADAQSAELKRLDERNKLVGNAVAALGDNPSLEQIDAVFASLEAQGVKGDRSRLPRDQSQVPAFIQEVRNGVMGVEKALANKRAELETQFKIKGPQTQLGKLMYDQDNYESGGGRFMGTVGQLTAGPQPQTVGSFLTADPGAPGVTIKPYTKTMPQPDADVEAEAGEPIRARNQFDVAIAREAFGNPEEFYYDTQGRVQQNKEITEAKDRRAEKGAVRVNAAGGDLIMGKTAQNKVDEGLLTSTAKSAGLSRIRDAYRPEFAQLKGRWNALVSSTKSKLGVELPDEEKALLKDFATYKRRAIENINAYIQEVTGAAMGVQEGERIKQAAPNPGQGLFDGDSPEEFEAKLEDVIETANLATARWTFIKRNGLNLKGDDLAKAYPLSRVPALINERGKMFEEEIKRQMPSMKPAEIRREVKARLAQEFGLVSD